MATPKKLSNFTREALRNLPSSFASSIQQIANGTSPHVKFSFKEVKIIRGTVPHVPSTDRGEIRKSVTLQFNGAPGGLVIAHLFSDGTIKTQADIHKQQKAIRVRNEELTATEARFPELSQTVVRQDAERKMMARIQSARNDTTWSAIRKQLEKQNAEEEYQGLLKEQAKKRADLTGFCSKGD